jgi:uncharacterized protein (TIGR02444 family)
MTATNPFWQFSLAFYKNPTMTDLCLKLQDVRGVDVNLLLYAIWRASLTEVVELQSLQSVEAVSVQWRDQVVRPLRRVRKILRAKPEFADSSEQLLQLELNTEHHQQRLMHACTISVGVGATVAASLELNMGVLWQHYQLPALGLLPVLHEINLVLRSWPVDPTG